MKISEDVYKLSGWEYGTNSNVYGIVAGDELILIDAGFSSVQYAVVQKNRMQFSELYGLPVKNVFLTHAHGDHAGLAYLYQEQGAKIHIGDKDGEAMEKVTPVTLEALFGESFHSCKADDVIKTRKLYRFADDVCIEAVPAPGHTAGNLLYLAEVCKKKIAFVGDILLIHSVTPGEGMELEIGWKGSPDFDEASNNATLEMLRKIRCDIVAFGHSAVYFGSLDELLEKSRIISEQ